MPGALAMGTAKAPWGYPRTREPAVVRVLRAARNGPASDNTAHAVTGTLAVIAVLGFARKPAPGAPSAGAPQRGDL
jgi:hypothetical protein